jgi:WD40 repeat protein
MYAIVLSPDGKTVATVVHAGGSGHVVDLWEAATGRGLRRLSRDHSAIEHAAFSPNGRTIAFTDRTRLYLADTTGAVPPRNLDVGIEHLVPAAVAYSPDGTTLAVAKDLELALFPTGRAETRWTLETPAGPHCLAFSPDGTVLAAVARTGPIRLLNAATGKVTATCARPRPPGAVEPPPPEREGPVALAFTPDGRCLTAAYGDCQVLRWEAATGKLRCRLPDFPCNRKRREVFHRSFLGLRGFTIVAGWDGHCTAFGSDGRVLAWGTLDGSFVLWHVASGKQLLLRRGHTGAVTCLAFSADSKILATGSEDATALLWDVSESPARQPSSPLDLDDLWKGLGEDGNRAFAAMEALGTVPARSVPFLAGRYRLTAEQRTRVARALAGLDHDDFTAREKATADLERRRTWRALASSPRGPSARPCGSRSRRSPGGDWHCSSRGSTLGRWEGNEYVGREWRRCWSASAPRRRGRRWR